MKKFNKILALGLAGASLVTGGFMLSGCDVTKNNDNTQTEQEQDEQKVVSSISLNSGSLPSYIIKGRFSRTNIKATVTYEDNTTKVIDVIESMFSETDKTKLKNVGQYNLTVNYGGKTATMYANVVDERYLLMEVENASLGKDITMTDNDDGRVTKWDSDNKILYINEPGYVSYSWVSGNCSYNYESEDNQCNKGLIAELDDVNDAYSWFALKESMITDGIDGNGNPWVVKSIEKDANQNYVLTANWGNDTFIYTYNEDFLLKVDEIENGGAFTYTTQYNYSPITLSLPAEIKAMESNATININDRISDLRDIMVSYLESDFEMSVYDNSSNTTYLYQKYDADNKILREYESDIGEESFAWVNGDYYYEYYKEDGTSVYKDNVSNWNRNIMVNCFTFDEVFDANRITVDVSEDGRYYELVLTSEGSDGEVWEYKYVFNYNEISKIDLKSNGQYMGSYTYNKTNVVLEVPAEIKALESSVFELQ